MTDKKQDVIEINEYGLFAFCAKAQELIKQGYEFDLTSNVRAPMSYGTMFVAYMVPVAEAVEQKEVLVLSPPPVDEQSEVVVTKPETEVKTDPVVEKPQDTSKVGRKKAADKE